MKKIAFISSGYLPLPPVKGGAVETLIDILLNSSRIQSKYQIDVYSIFDKEAIEETSNQNNINYIYIKSSFIMQKALRYIINKYTRKYIGNDYIANLIKENKKKLLNYDYVIVENKPEFGLILRKYVKGKLILHSHNDFLNKDTKHAKAITKSYDQIYALSKYICNRIKEISPQDCKNKIKLLYNGIDISKFKLKENDINIKKLKKRYNIQKNDIVFLYTGRLVPEKGIKELICAFNEIQDKHYKLLIIGSVSYGKTQKNSFTDTLVQLSKKNKNIIYTGYVSYKEMPFYYHLANYGVVPSLWEEPFALTVIEHLASGHPLVVANSGAIPELVTTKCALIINKNKNYIQKLKEGLVAITTANMSKKDCIEQASLFSKEQYIKTFLKLLVGENNEN